MIITGYRQDQTGTITHRFFHEKNAVCTVSSIVAPIEKTHITGMDYSLVSEFDMDSTIFPGLSRSVLDERTGRQIWKLVYHNAKRYDIEIGNDVIYVMIYDRDIRFHKDKMDVAIVTPEGNGVPSPTPAACMACHMSEDLNDAEKLAILTFAILRFAL